MTHAESQKKYKRTEKGKLAQKKYYFSQAKKDESKKWQQRNRLKHNVHNIVYNATKSGKLLKQNCEVCGKKNAFAHHDDYSQPLEVRWLCNYHHSGQLHQNLGVQL